MEETTHNGAVTTCLVTPTRFGLNEKAPHEHDDSNKTPDAIDSVNRGEIEWMVLFINIVDCDDQNNISLYR
jgi:hypothetical protein